MAQYKQHAKFNIFLALPILLVIAFFSLHPHPRMLMTFAISFIYCTLFMNPDLDLVNQIRLFSIRGFFTLPFRFYNRIFGNRGISHHPIMGSFTRILWLVGWACLIFFLVYKAMPTKMTFLKFYKHYSPFILFALAGVILADWCHLLLDRKKKS